MNRLLCLAVCLLCFAGSASGGILADARDATGARDAAIASVDLCADLPQAYLGQCSFDILNEIVVSDELSQPIAVVPSGDVCRPNASGLAKFPAQRVRPFLRGQNLLRPV